MQATVPAIAHVAKILSGLLLVFAAPDASCGQHMPGTILYIQSDKAAPAQGGYAQAVRLDGAHRLLFVSGQIPVDAHGKVPTTFAGQCRQVWANIVHQLEAAGMGPEHIVKVNTYLADRAHAAENSQMRREVLGDLKPALTIVIAGIYDPAWLLEVEVVAAMPMGVDAQPGAGQ